MLFVVVVDTTVAERNVTDLFSWQYCFSVLMPHLANNSYPVVKVVCSYLTRQLAVFIRYFHFFKLEIRHAQLCQELKQPNTSILVWSKCCSVFSAENNYILCIVTGSAI